MGRRHTPAKRTSSSVPAPSERRRHHQARAAFDCACSMLAPFFAPDTGWQGRSLHHVSVSLIRENFPHLPHEEVQALLGAAERLLAGGNDLASGPAG